jgi:acetyltransferase-like isoleucine patch superfamily enzyme
VTRETFIHPTAIVESGVTIGSGTAIWDGVHLRGPSRIGSSCIIGEKTYVAYDVEIADLVKVNARVYVCAGVRIERGVMVSAGVIFTNDRYPRATDPDLSGLAPSTPNEHTLETFVREGATIGAGAIIGPGIEIGMWSMVGMGSVVTKSVPAFHLSLGNPARSVAVICKCGNPLHKFGQSTTTDLSCETCGRKYSLLVDQVTEK